MPKSSYEDENGVFLNNFDIKDAKELRDVEYQITARQARAWEVRPRDKEFGFGLVRLKAIHRHLMGEIYPWAGKIRTVTSRKRGPFKNVTNFTAPENIDADWKMLEQKISKFLESNQTDVDENVKELTDIFVQANQIHPFPDGNGRSLQSFMQDLAREKDIDLDYANVSREEWNQACSVSGVHGKLFEGNIFIKSESDDTKIKTIFKKIAKQI